MKESYGAKTLMLGHSFNAREVLSAREGSVYISVSANQHIPRHRLLRYVYQEQA